MKFPGSGDLQRKRHNSSNQARAAFPLAATLGAESTLAVFFVWSSQLSGGDFPVNSLISPATIGTQFLGNRCQVEVCSQPSPPRMWQFPDVFPVNDGERLAHDNTLLALNTESIPDQVEHNALVTATFSDFDRRGPRFSKISHRARLRKVLSPTGAHRHRVRDYAQAELVTKSEVTFSRPKWYLLPRRRFQDLCCSSSGFPSSSPFSRSGSDKGATPSGCGD